ncbi:hypothetical protein K2173_007129 [Erythroxylum novogranatense]|uniref:Uncharacterized protein n=1 Tax=Erythroxylum novogranatense TaxID=1862640 RepID=A0AAV8SYN0_9ROSI|nr:hypothetical protein K2173_007129 [Erythroxylum novogranatense]
MFVEANARGSIFDVIQHRNLDDFNKLLPFESSQVNDLVAAVQVTHFDCGGTVIGLLFQHKIGDGMSSINFLNNWGEIARGNNHVSSPCFDLAVRFPPINLEDFDHNSEVVKENVSSKWFMCNAKSIAALRDRYGENSDTAGKTIRPSKIETLTAFITSRIMAATHQSVNSSDRTYLVHHPINLRPRMDPPLSKQHFGNIIIEPVVATADLKANDGWCYGIISQMRETISSVDAEYVKNLKGEEYLDIMKKRAEKFKAENVTSIVFTSACRFPLYDVDFGWGKAVWIGMGGWPFHNMILFLDSKVEGDIEVHILLKDEVMANFVNDEELHAFLSPIPFFPFVKELKPQARL